MMIGPAPCVPLCSIPTVLMAFSTVYLPSQMARTKINAPETVPLTGSSTAVGMVLCYKLRNPGVARRSPCAMPPSPLAAKNALLRAGRGVGRAVSCVTGSIRACPSPTTWHLGPVQGQGANENSWWLPHRRKGCTLRSHAGVDRARAQVAARGPGGAGACSDVTGAGPCWAPLGPRAP